MMTVLAPMSWSFCIACLAEEMSVIFMSVNNLWKYKKQRLITNLSLLDILAPSNNTEYLTVKHSPEAF
jgi:hypothetical protein